MTESKALMLVFVGTLFAVATAILGLAALEVNGSALFLGFIVPTVIGSHLCSRVVMHYGESSKRHR